MLGIQSKGHKRTDFGSRLSGFSNQPHGNNHSLGYNLRSVRLFFIDESGAVERDWSPSSCRRERAGVRAHTSHDQSGQGIGRREGLGSARSRYADTTGTIAVGGGDFVGRPSDVPGNVPPGRQVFYFLGTRHDSSTIAVSGKLAAPASKMTSLTHSVSNGVRQWGQRRRIT